MEQRRCPDCGVTMKETTVRDTEGMRLSITTGKRNGLLGKVGVQNTAKVQGVCCPECGLVRLYADLE
ncbi:hypothetical protein C488_02700 [Natrinema pellirubrum DSM 15624]|uniref:Uncharacterized protein n=1 Tax=Natrinema pellirubrum (strain DSM 15624 / CIP 106293 / JCM 10476 / NCIMB 786 / 157) TaxID=797303 RepID=L0JHF1_NATP1|nr:hypothetical protein [Natrinema pellirubrum]AGB30955.1 hypothetical protein Natpe_1043 [Natrinema pellirubrum DSM 15624]ELY80662.1 hypothetical protein C488_02700 [Natrinema pellirubrum DSM 15624]